ncbi:helix-turn-helix domain-containing protein [Clostridium butyricum]|uniref:helix-turn-helix domain-containing protein n=1 Tax=Clostridium butyricum TaxID=1492 RepID=UPI0011DC815E|nr:helix-turn-helix domain-containing protein [Clostridium butyricum]MCQ2017145.1 helix-turn-helix domain-containing protein [Clostridium butyricum]MCQ2021025.1 helix-turn-helix domain-containing protein [Clostridium butyricum]NFB72825.1 DNA-binding protein [Clostridium butyricum]NFB91001.1 DNA-binding protein [Clostridium butyricum]UTY53712.1 helix-turn-helix domain-containing protein [Clostridium butyricum]
MLRNNLYKVKEVADIIGCSVWCTYELIRRNKLEVVKCGADRRRILISEESITKYMSK